MEFRTHNTPRSGWLRRSLNVAIPELQRPATDFRPFLTGRRVVLQKAGCLSRLWRIGMQPTGNPRHDWHLVSAPNEVRYVDPLTNQLRPGL